VDAAAGNVDDDSWLSADDVIHKRVAQQSNTAQRVIPK
jgi:hypothetical protein